MKNNGISFDVSNAKIKTSEALEKFLTDFQTELTNLPEDDNARELGRAIFQKYKDNPLCG